MTYESLMKFAFDNGISNIRELPLKYNLNGVYKNNKIIIDSNLTQLEKKCVLSEEIGHHFKTVGNIIDDNNIGNCKQELIARRWGYEKLVSIQDIIRSFEYGCVTSYEIADYLDVTDCFFEDCIKHYSWKYGEYFSKDNYIIIFIPRLAIYKKF